MSDENCDEEVEIQDGGFAIIIHPDDTWTTVASRDDASLASEAGIRFQILNLVLQDPDLFAELKERLRPKGRLN